MEWYLERVCLVADTCWWEPMLLYYFTIFINREQRLSTVWGRARREDDTQYLPHFPGNSVLTVHLHSSSQGSSLWRRDSSVTWPLPDPRARSGLEQKLFPINPLRDCPIHPSLMPHGVLVLGIRCCPILGKQIRDFFPLVWRGSRTSIPIHSSMCCVIL